MAPSVLAPQRYEARPRKYNNVPTIKVAVRADVEVENGTGRHRMTHMPIQSKPDRSRSGVRKTIRALPVVRPGGYCSPLHTPCHNATTKVASPIATPIQRMRFSMPSSVTSSYLIHGVPPNSLRYLRVGGRGFYLGAEKTQSQKNACKSRRIPSFQCTLCWAAVWKARQHSRYTLARL